MKLKYFLAGVLCLCAAYADARPRGGSGAASACNTFTSDLANDGCQSAPAGRIQDSTLFTTMRQSGQLQYFSAPATQRDHPVSWNVAARDYGVGNVGLKCGGTCKIPGVDALPTNVTLDSVNHYVQLNFSSGADITLQGWDFTGWSVALTGTGGGTLHYWNNYWEDSSFTNSQASLTGFGIIRTATNSCTNIEVLSSEFIRDFATYPVATWQYYVANTGSGACKPTTTIHYSYFRSVPQHAVRQDSSGAADVRWNYFRGYGQCSDGNGGITTPSSCAHGNFFVGLQNQLVVDTQTVDFNTMWLDDQSMSGTALIAWFLDRLAGGPIHYTMLHATNNILVTNTNNHYSAKIGTTGDPIKFSPQLTGVDAVVDAAVLNKNYIDCTGAFNRGIQGTSNVSSVLSAANNILLLNGQTIGVPPDQFMPTGANGCQQF